MMRGLSLWQPHASLMQIGVKTFETRNRATFVRGDVAICSCAALTNQQYDSWITPAIRKAFREHGIDDFWTLPAGKVLCVVELYECMPTERIGAVKPFGEEPFGNYLPGRFAWATRNLRVLKEPVPCKGKQGFFFLPADVEVKVRAQI